MIDAPHFGFVVAAYAFATVVVLGMIGAILWDYRAQSAALRRLEAARNERESS
jgi:heme exporter protein CcmD